MNGVLSANFVYKGDEVIIECKDKKNFDYAKELDLYRQG